VRGSIRKRGSSWQLAVYVGYERGRSRYRYETVTGGRREAERRLTQLMADVDSGRLGPSRAGTLEDLATAWWDARADQLSPTTRREYRRLLDRRILPVLGSKRVDRIKPADIERYYASLRRGDAPGGGELSAASIRAIHGILRSMFKAAVRWGYVTTNPLREIDPPRRAKTGLAPPLPEEVARLLARADEIDPELGAYLRLAAASGARRGELGALRWTDVDLEGGEVVIARAVVLDGARSYLEKDTKTHQRRAISLDDATVVSLTALRKRAAENALRCGVSLPADAFLFSPEADGSIAWNPDHWTYAFVKLRAEVGVNCRLHDLRHYHGTELADAGIPLTAVRDRLGHTSLATTSIYAHARRVRDKAAAEAIGKVLPD